MDDRQRTIQSVDRALEILMYLSEQREAATVEEIAAALGQPASTVYRYLQVLRVHDFVTPLNGRGSYGLGLGVLRLSQGLQEGVAPRRAGRPIMERLAAATDETIVLMGLINDGVICIERIESPHALRYSFRVGQTGPLHAGASSKVLLAYMPPQQRARVLAGHLRQITDRTIIDPAALDDNLAQVRQLGYALSEGELDPGARAVAVPVFEAGGAVRYGLSLVAPANRLPFGRVEEVAEMLRRGAEEIAARLAGRRGDGTEAWREG